MIHPSGDFFLVGSPDFSEVAHERDYTSTITLDGFNARRSYARGGCQKSSPHFYLWQSRNCNIIITFVKFMKLEL